MPTTAWERSLAELPATLSATLLLEEPPIGCATLWLELLELELEAELLEVLPELLWLTAEELLWEVPPLTWELRELEVLREVEEPLLC